MACSSCGKRGANARLANIPASVPHTQLAREPAQEVQEVEPEPEFVQVPVWRDAQRQSPAIRQYCVDEQCFESFMEARRVASELGGLRVVAKRI